MRSRVCIGLVLVTAAAAACVARPAAEEPRWPRAPRSPETEPLAPRLLPQLLAELGARQGPALPDAEALHELYYYPDWMDFGRRSAEGA